ncbi:MAG: hypothetical protein EXR71_08320 [Myxococcales bacterium]|nr:hypothetical protein [Myxococcales bacterium]
MGATIWLLAGPPFDAPFFGDVLARLVATGHPDVQVRSVVSLGPTWAAAADELARGVGPVDVLVAHGLAIPVALAVAARVPVGHVVLINGPLIALDALSDAVVRAAMLPGAAETLFRPGTWLRWLRSSIGLRRAVNNPYAMDRDTVAVVCGGLVADGAARRALCTWLQSVASPWPPPSASSAQVTLFWGDNDRLHPLGEADAAAISGENIRTRVASGGRFAWPLEMPWALADALRTIAAVAARIEPTATAGSRLAPPARKTSPGRRKEV